MEKDYVHEFILLFDLAIVHFIVILMKMFWII